MRRRVTSNLILTFMTLALLTLATLPLSAAHVSGKVGIAGNFKVVFATEPGFPEVGKPAKLIFSIQDGLTGRDATNIKASIKILHDENAVFEINDALFDYGDFEFTFTFPTEGLYRIIIQLTSQSEPASVWFLIETAGSGGLTSRGPIVIGIPFAALVIGIVIGVGWSRRIKRAQKASTDPLTHSGNSTFASNLYAMNLDNTSVFSLVNSVIKLKPYSRIVFFAATAYAIFFMFSTQMVVYQTYFRFSEIFGSVPKLFVSTDGPIDFYFLGYLPSIAWYPDEHWFVGIRPGPVIVLLTQSFLVGINAAIMVLGRRMACYSSNRSSLGILGSVPSLFTTLGCCCCAPLYLLIFGAALADYVGDVLFRPYFGYFLTVSYVLLILGIILGAKSIRKSCKFRLR